MEKSMSNTEKSTEKNNTSLSSEDGIEKSDQTLIGPIRTPTSKNALVHGLYASEIVLPWESEKDLETLFRELKIEWMPHGRQEMETVLSIARLNFLKHRLMRSTQIAFRRDPFLAELEKDGAKSWADVAARLEERSKTDDQQSSVFKETGEQLNKTLVDITTHITAQDRDMQEIWRKVELVNDLFDRLSKDYFAFVKKEPSTKKLLTPNAFIANPTDLLEQAYHPDYLE